MAGQKLIQEAQRILMDRSRLDDIQADAFKVYKYTRLNGASTVTRCEAVNDYFRSRGLEKVNHL
jgi:hypothetical protein